MRIEIIAGALVAALLTTGGVTATTRVVEYGAQPTTQVQQETLPAQPEIQALLEEETKKLTKQEAIAIALAHAELTEADVTALWGNFDWDDRIPEWDISFHYGDWEYDYEIHAETGEVRKWERDYEPPKSVATEPAPTQPPVQETKRITAAEAEAKALAHAGLTADQVKYLRSEFDYDDGRPEWEVEFFHDGWEYSYDIHAESGKIRSWDKDRDD